jgi:hypothetical protein
MSVSDAAKREAETPRIPLDKDEIYFSHLILSLVILHSNMGNGRTIPIKNVTKERKKIAFDRFRDSSI